MTIIQRVTLRHLKQNKKSTIVTLIGVIISVAMITAVTTLTVSFIDMMRRQVMNHSGAWHLTYENVNESQFEALSELHTDDQIMFYRSEGYAYLEGSENRHRPYVYLSSYSKTTFDAFSIVLSAGRLPTAADEVLISEEIMRTSGVDFAIGDTIEVEIGQRFYVDEHGDEHFLDQSTSLLQDEELVNKRLRALTVVGIMKRPSTEASSAPGYTILTYLDAAAIAEKPVTVPVYLSRLNNQLYLQAETTAMSLSISSVRFNNDLLRYYGISSYSDVRFTLYGLAAIIMLIIVIGSVTLIYNAFAISVSERTRHLGMLSSIGATRVQKRNAVFFEAFIIGLISIPLGILSGVGGMALTFAGIRSIIEKAFHVSEPLLVRVNSLQILLTIALSVLTIFISTWRPARRASRISAIDAIRQTSDIKLQKRDFRTSHLSRRVFGLEGEIAIKNLKRNRKRYWSTVLSITMSVVLFLSASYFTQTLARGMEIGENAAEYDILLNLSVAESTESVINLLRDRSEVDQWIHVRALNLYANLPISNLALSLQDTAADMGFSDDDLYMNSLEIYSLDQAAFDDYVARVGVDPAALNDAQNPTAIVFRLAVDEDLEQGHITHMPASQLGVGDHFDAFNLLYDEESDDYLHQDLLSIEILALTDERPMGISLAPPGSQVLIVSDAWFDRLAAEVEFLSWNSILLTSSDPMATQYALEDIPGAHIFNQYESRQSSLQLLLLMKVFTYGFISLMTLICVANIFNSISTSIALRRREFAMLKSVGMTPNSFSKMIRFESLFYGLRALLFGLPVSLAFIYLIYEAMSLSIRYPLELPWASVVQAVVAVFIIVRAAMIYSASKLRHDTIVDAIKDENV